MPKQMSLMQAPFAEDVTF